MGQQRAERTDVSQTAAGRTGRCVGVLDAIYTVSADQTSLDHESISKDRRREQRRGIKPSRRGQGLTLTLTLTLSRGEGSHRLVGVRACPRRPQPGQSEVSDPELTPLGGQDVARLQVAVDHAVVVKKLQQIQGGNSERMGKVRQEHVCVQRQ